METPIPAVSSDLSRYEPRWFVNRDEEFKKIQERVQQAQSGAVTEPIINYWGIQGIGKSWLLQHTRFTFKFRGAPATPLLKPTFTLLYTFDDAESTASLPNIIKALSTDLLAQIPLERLSEEEQAYFHKAKENGEVNAFVRGLNRISQRFAPVLLLDDTQRVAFQQWKTIEHQLVEPIIVTNRVVIVIAGRKQIPHWHRFEVRRRVTEPGETAMAPFTREQVTQQLEKRRFAVPVEWIMPHTTGSPGLVVRFADQFTLWKRDQQEKETERKWLERHRDDLLTLIADSKSELLKNTPANLRPNIDLLFPLRFYRSEALQFMHAQQSTGERQPDDLPGIYFLNVLKRLEFESDVVWWDDNRRAYVTSPVVRQLTRQHLLFAGKEKYIQSHQTALRMYWKSAEEFRRVCEDFILEIWFHLASIYHENRDKPSFEREFQKTIDFTRKNLNLDRLYILKRLFDGDLELKDLLPAKIHEQMSGKLENMLE